MHKAIAAAQASKPWSLPSSIALALLLGAASSLCAQDAAPRIRGTDTHAIFRAVGSFYSIDPELLEAIAAVESGGNPSAVSPKGARGLMQLMPATAHRFRADNSMDPVENGLAAARFLAYLRSRQETAPGSKPHLPELLAAYNAGETAVAKYRGIPRYAETRGYVRQVLLRYLFDRLPPKFAASARKDVADELGSAKSNRNREDALAQLTEIRRQRDAALTSPMAPAGLGAEVKASVRQAPVPPKLARR